MLEIFQYQFMQNALIAGALIAAICSVIGVFLVLRRMSLIGDGLAHISFGLFFWFYPLFSAFIFAVLAALGIERLKRMKVYGDAAIAIFFSFGLALGVVLISLSKGFTVDLFSYLFGSILAVGGTDLLFMAALGILTLALVSVFYKELLYTTFDEDSAKASGIGVGRVNTMLIVLTALAVVASMRIVGILLVSSFIVIPASIALMLCRNFRQAILVSASIGIASSVAGLFASYYLDLAAGGAIVLVLVLLFFLALVYKSVFPKSN
jgi:zinc transport system permease protein